MRLTRIPSFIGGNLRPSRWSVAVRLAATCVAIVATTVGITAWMMTNQFESVMRGRADNRLHTNLNVARELLGAKTGGMPVRVEGDRLVAQNGYILDGDTAFVDRVKASVDGAVTIFRGDLRVATTITQANGTRATGTRLAQGPVYDAVLRRGQAFIGEADILGKPHFTAYDPIKDQDGKVVGILFVGISQTSYLAPVTDARRVTTSVSIVLVILAGAAIFLAVRRIFRPLDGLRAALGQLAAGNLGAEVSALGRHDEIGRMAQAVQGLKETAGAARDLETAQKADMAARSERSAKVERLARDFETQAAEVLEAVTSASTEFDATAIAMSQTATGNVESAGAMAAATQQASANVQAVAASTEEMAASVAEIARQVSNSAASSRRAAEAAKASDSTVRGLAESAERVGGVVRLIADVANRTNLLALNATIEAARAGEAGKGFAVVASEVKQLAQQTAQATDDIVGHIASMRGETTKAVDAIREIALLINEVNELTEQVAAASEEQSAATQEIGRAVSEAAQGTGQVARLGEGLAHGAQATSSAADQVRSASAGLSRNAEILKARVDSFLSAIRSA